MSTMQLTSPDFVEGGRIPERFTCDGENINPTLEIGGVPQGTNCLALIVDDPDAPNGTFTHWVLWDISFKTSRIEAGSLPMDAKEGVNSAGKAGYIGPCPPSGTHRYFFKLFALDTPLELEPVATVAELEEKMQGHLVARAELVGLYSKR